jgi:hypothetical protein
MVYLLSKKRGRDAALLADWRRRDPAMLAKLALPHEAIEWLQHRLRGHIVLPGDPTYDASRKLFNPLYDPHPALIAYCVVEQDIRHCLEMVHTHKIPFRIRSGGHSTAGYSGGDGMIIDFGKLNAVLEPYGLHLPTGECEDVHVSGFMQGGGYGFTSRKFGIQCDHVLEVRVMLHDGRIVRATESHNHDLWWAVRGGTGGNFGVLLTIRYRLHRLGPVWGWAIAWPLKTAADRIQATEAMMALQKDFMRQGVPDDMTAQVQICNQSDWADGSDRAPWLLIRGMYLGPAAEGEKLLKPLLATPGARLQFTRTGTFRELNTYLLSQPHEIPQLPPDGGMPKEDKQARFVARDLTPTEWQEIFDFFVTSPNPWSYMCLELYGGAINAYPAESSAFIHRNVAFSAFLDVFWYYETDKPAAEKFLTDWCTLMDRFSNGHIYQNYPSPDVPDYRSNYFGAAFPALLAVKRKYDPHTTFTFEQAIKPRHGTPEEKPVWPPRVIAALAEPIQ